MTKQQNYCGWCGTGLGFLLGFRATSHSHSECTSVLVSQLRAAENKISILESKVDNLEKIVLDNCK